MNPSDIITGIGVNVVWLVIGVVVASVAKIVSKKGVARALLGWRFNKQNAVVIGAPLGIPPGTYELKRDDGMPIFGLGPLHAAHRIWRLVEDAYPSLRPIPLAISRDFDDRSLSNSIVSIGYPSGNSISKRLWDLADQIPIVQNDRDILLRESGETIAKWRMEENKIIEDYGLVLYFENPTKPGEQVIILTGTETFGVKAASEFLTPQNILKIYGIPWLGFPLFGIIYSAIFQSRKPLNRAFVVKCRVNGLATSAPELVRTIEF